MPASPIRDAATGRNGPPEIPSTKPPPPGAPQVHSKRRVSEFGEVFTAEREVNAMLDLVKPETERIESRFLEPACGTGNFLTEILHRKLAVVATRFTEDAAAFHFQTFLAASSIYGIDILEDNVLHCRERLLALVNEHYQQALKRDCPEDIAAAIRFVLEQNILWGDALSLHRVDGTDAPIVFAEWSPISEETYTVKRRDFSFAGLTQSSPHEGEVLFSDLGDSVFIPKPEKEYPPTDYRALATGNAMLPHGSSVDGNSRLAPAINATPPPVPGELPAKPELGVPGTSALPIQTMLNL